MAHYIIIIIIIVIIVLLQSICFYITLQKANLFKNIFPDNHKLFILDQFVGGELYINIKHESITLRVIINSINNYLNNNKSAISDYHLIKDIVDRNCDAKEEDINTLIPVPLYLGLAGTMLGILIGIGILVFGGGLNNLLNAGNSSGAEGVESLLGGVAIAMGSSFVGIVLTTISSWFTKSAKETEENNKNTFLSWLQASLLPKLSDGTAAVLEKVTRDLTQFNNTFSENTREMKAAFSTIKDTYKDLSSVLNAINHLKISDIAKYNIEVYNSMRNTTQEIGNLGEQLKGVNQYLSATNDVVEKLDIVFDREITQFDERIGAVKKAVGKIDDGLSQSLTKLNENSSHHLEVFMKSSSILNERFEKAVDEQQYVLENTIAQQQDRIEEAFTKQETSIKGFGERQEKTLESKSKEIELIVSGLQNITAVKTSIGNLAQATKEQNDKFDRLANSIEKLAQMKTNEGCVVHPLTTIPKWIKITSIVIGGCISFVGLFYVIITTLELYR